MADIPAIAKIKAMWPVPVEGNVIVFDIETGQLPNEQLKALLPPLDESKIDGLVTGEFDPQSVRVGNMKDPAKIREKIEAARAAHEAARSNADAIITGARESHWEQFVERAALSAITGRVLAIGYLATESGRYAIDDGGALECGIESDILANFWRKYTSARAANRKMVGHNIANFDVPFIVRRSWILGMDVPPTVRERGRYLDSIFVDTEEIWSCGTRDTISLDALGQALDGGRKPDGVDGSMFARLWFGTEEEKQQAVDYLINDLRMTAEVAERMGII